MFDKAFIVAVAVAGVTEWLKNLLPSKVKENNALMAVIAGVISVCGAVGYQFANKAIDPSVTLTWQSITVFTVIVVGLVQASYNLLIQTFKAIVTKLKAKVSTTTDVDAKAEEIADTIVSKVESAITEATTTTTTKES